MFNVSSIQDLKSTSVVNDPFLKVRSILPDSPSNNQFFNDSMRTDSRLSDSYGLNDTMNSKKSTGSRNKNALFVPDPPERTHFDYQDTLKQLNSPPQEHFETKILKKPVTDGDEEFHRRVANLKNEIHWSDREYHAMALDPKAMTESEKKKLNEKLSAIQRDERDLRYYPEGIGDALSALRAEEDELKKAYKMMKYNEFSEPIKEVKKKKKINKIEKWWEWTSSEFTPRLRRNRIEQGAATSPNFKYIIAPHDAPWRPQSARPTSFDRSPHPMFGQSIHLHKKG